MQELAQPDAKVDVAYLSIARINELLNAQLKADAQSAEAEETVGLTEEVKEPDEIEARERVAEIAHRMRVTNSKIEKYGLTPGCPFCDKSRAQHQTQRRMSGEDCGVDEAD